jgi:hypothetical protein
LLGTSFPIFKGGFPLPSSTDVSLGVFFPLVKGCGFSLPNAIPAISNDAISVMLFILLSLVFCLLETIVTTDSDY